MIQRTKGKATKSMNRVNVTSMSVGAQILQVFWFQRVLAKPPHTFFFFCSKEGGRFANKIYTLWPPTFQYTSPLVT